MLGRKIYADCERRVEPKPPIPLAHLFHGSAQNISFYRNNQPCLFRERYEVFRQEHAVPVPPPYQSFESRDSSVSERDDRLVMHNEIPAINRSTQIRLALDPGCHVCAHIFVEYFHLRLAG